MALSPVSFRSGSIEKWRAYSAPARTGLGGGCGARFPRCRYDQSEALLPLHEPDHPARPVREHVAQRLGQHRNPIGAYPKVVRRGHRCLPWHVGGVSCVRMGYVAGGFSPRCMRRRARSRRLRRRARWHRAQVSIRQRPNDRKQNTHQQLSAEASRRFVGLGIWTVDGQL